MTYYYPYSTTYLADKMRAICTRFLVTAIYATSALFVVATAWWIGGAVLSLISN